GGGAMFMEQGNCITYSLVVPTSLVEGLSFEQSYAYLDDWVMGALAEIGVRARYVPLNDIASEQGKIGGAAQRRFAGGVLLHHVTMAYDIDADKMGEVLRIGKEKLSDKGTRSADKRVDPMRSQTGLAREQIIDGFLEYFRARYDTVDATYTEAELARARGLVETKSGTGGGTPRGPWGAPPRQGAGRGRCGVRGTGRATAVRAGARRRGRVADGLIAARGGVCASCCCHAPVHDKGRRAADVSGRLRCARALTLSPPALHAGADLGQCPP